MIIYFYPIIGAIIAWSAAHFFLRSFFNQDTGRSNNLAGMIEANKPDLAKQIAGIIQSKILKEKAFTKNITDPAIIENIKPSLETYLNEFVQVKLVEKFPVIGMLGGHQALEKIKETLMEEMSILLPSVIEKYAGQIQDKIKIEEIVAQEINNMSVE